MIHRRHPGGGAVKVVAVPAAGPNTTAGSEHLFLNASEILMKEMYRRKLVLGASSVTILALVLIYCDSSKWPFVQTLVQSPGFLGDQPLNDDILYDGKWFWPAKGVGSECNSCMLNILKQHQPWILRQRSYAEDALSCVYSVKCRKAATSALMDSLHDSDPRASEESLAARKNAADESPEQMLYTAFKLDQRQYDLNWRRAQAFSRLLGGPSQSPPPIVLTEWVPPLDPVGRPVPSWLAFRPVDLPPWLRPAPAAAAEQRARAQALAEAQIRRAACSGCMLS